MAKNEIPESVKKLDPVIKQFGIKPVIALISGQIDVWFAKHRDVFDQMDEYLEQRNYLEGVAEGPAKRSFNRESKTNKVEPTANTDYPSSGFTQDKIVYLLDNEYQDGTTGRVLIDRIMELEGLSGAAEEKTITGRVSGGLSYGVKSGYFKKKKDLSGSAHFIYSLKRSNSTKPKKNKQIVTEDVEIPSEYPLTGRTKDKIAYMLSNSDNGLTAPEMTKMVMETEGLTSDVDREKTRKNLWVCLSYGLKNLGVYTAVKDKGRGEKKVFRYKLVGKEE